MKVWFALFLAFWVSCSRIAADIVYVYSHGLGQSGVSAISYVKDHCLEKVKAHDVISNEIKEIPSYSKNTNSFYILNKPLHYFNYPCAHDVGLTIEKDGTITRKRGVAYPEKVSLAQHLEIETLKNEIDSIASDCILFGNSMGAATIITYAAQYKPKNVKAIILDAPFDTVERVMQHKLGFWNKLGLGWLYLKYWYPSYNSKGVKPANVAHLIETHIPILFVHSKKDALVPIDASRALYQAIKESGNNKVHIFELDHATHANAHESADADNYQKVVHAFYKKYNLPCDEQLALKGMQLLSTTQP